MVIPKKFRTNKRRNRILLKKIQRIMFLKFIFGFGLLGKQRKILTGKIRFITDKSNNTLSDV